MTKLFKTFKWFKPLPLFLPRDAGESLPRTRSGDEGGGLNPSAALRAGSAQRWNGLNDLNFLIEKLMVWPRKVTL